MDLYRVRPYPLRYLGNDPIMEIASFLDFRPAFRVNYLSFGERLGLSPQTVRSIGSRNGSPTVEIFNAAISMGKTTADVQDVLIDMESGAVDVIPMYIEDVKLNIQLEQQARQARCMPKSVEENSCSCIECFRENERSVCTHPSMQCFCRCHTSQIRGFPTTHESPMCSHMTQINHNTSLKTTDVSRDILERLSGRATCVSDCPGACSHLEDTNLAQRHTIIEQDRDRITNALSHMQISDALGNRSLPCGHNASHSNSCHIGDNNILRYSTGSYPDDNQSEYKIPRTRSDTSKTVKPQKRVKNDEPHRHFSNDAGYVFLTYSIDATDEMISLLKCLISEGIKVKFDLWNKTLNEGLADDTSLRSYYQNVNDWIEMQLRTAKFVIILLSPQYADDISPPTEHDNSAAADDHSLHTRFIHDIIRNEYVKNGSVNYRFIPVTLPEKGTTKKHIPEYLRSTMTFEYPDEVDHITDHILRGR